MAQKAKRRVFLHLRPRMFRYFDWSLLLSMYTLIVIGIISIACATASPVSDKNASLAQILSEQSLYYPRLQLIWTGLGTAAIFCIMFINYKFIASKTLWIYFMNIMLLFFVLLGERGRGNMAGWYKIGKRTFQPSEVAKLAIILALAKQFAIQKKPISTFKELFSILMFIGVPLVLIFLQPDFGTAFVYIFMFVLMLYMSGISMKLMTILGACGVVVILVGGYLLTKTGSFRIDRILVFLGSENVSADASYQTKYAQIAVGSGQVFGKGIFAVGSLSQLGFVSDDHTDFLYSITCETFGFAGGFLVILIYLYMILRMFYLSRKIEDKFASLTIIGIASMMLFHIFENIGMVIGVTPVTGIPLPFMSYGGTNLLLNMASMGIVLNVSMVCRYHQEIRQRKRDRESARME